MLSFICKIFIRGVAGIQNHGSSWLIHENRRNVRFIDDQILPIIFLLHYNTCQFHDES